MVSTDIKQSLLTAFNTANKVKPPIQPADVNFSVPEIWLQGQCNSRINIVARADSNNFGGVQTLYYVRRRLSEDLRGIKVPGKSSSYKRFYDVLKVLRDTLGVPLSDNEFLDRNISGPTVTIATTPACLAYLPSDSITLEYTEN
ncbi:virion structural protein [Pseudomonas phage 201phi2-1]|uniref:Virion structural protein n=1 Tax=Pseudomonas phage 201phi2-1 TaxID=198110 RepID=B3FJ73_BP201|nr:virion structural protein [Pseudomonas phage 201phi2-1]ABY63040.1 virion structural protein [Pseudomonas phage 201phi2-1]